MKIHLFKLLILGRHSKIQLADNTRVQWVLRNYGKRSRFCFPFTDWSHNLWLGITQTSDPGTDVITGGQPMVCKQPRVTSQNRTHRSYYIIKCWCVDYWEFSMCGCFHEMFFSGSVIVAEFPIVWGSCVFVERCVCFEAWGLRNHLCSVFYLCQFLFRMRNMCGWLHIWEDLLYIMSRKDILASERWQMQLMVAQNNYGC